MKIPIESRKVIKLRYNEAFEVEIQGVKYALNQKTGELYDLDSYEKEQPVKGKLHSKRNG